MKLKNIYHPFLFAIYPLMYIALTLKEPYKINSFIYLLILIVVLIAISFTLVIKISKYPDRWFILLTFFLIWFFSYNSLQSLFRFKLFGLMIWSHSYFIPLWILMLCLCSIPILRIKTRTPNIHLFLNITGLLLFLITLSNYVLTQKPNYDKWEPKEQVEILQHIKSINKYPDIYYIIVDAYAGETELRSELGFDNSTFIFFLKSKGFFIPSKSYSNYSTTFLTVVSCLNMNYVPLLEGKSDSSNCEYKPTSIANAIGNNMVTKMLKSVGYKYLDLSIWHDLIKIDDFQLNYQSSIDQYILAVVNMTPFSKPIARNFLVGIKKTEGDLHKIDALLSFHGSEVPVFSYVHLSVTHDPYVFSQNGIKLSNWTLINQSTGDKNLYIDQVKCANMWIMKIVDTLLSISKRPPIIIIQGDHGPALLTDPDRNLRLRMSNLSAYYVPENFRKQLNDTISSVNSFRLVFNSVFGTNLKILPNKHYYYSVDDNVMIDVSSKLKQ